MSFLLLSSENSILEKFLVLYDLYREKSLGANTFG
jgi:hypothetical protein